ncbi:MAG: DUF1553 domain-containing protein [Gemmatales bacterium]|nr:DUF1553 domain-containing protein [Gemmatales bacterium]MDW8222699.1 DUF1553 domain-containing protein [Gemmatales bacterium]
MRRTNVQRKYLRGARWYCVLLVGWILSGHAVLAANESAPPPAAVKTLTVFPTELKLQGEQATAQVVITGELANGVLCDLTHAVQWHITESQVVRVHAGRLQALQDGTTEVAAQYGDKSVRFRVTVSHTKEPLPINFPNQIVPIFTKLGCNAGGCHGKSSGQNGFKLSLLGFEPEIDYNAIVKEARGRRVFPAAPDNSLLLLKATGQMPHGGGKRLEKDSEEYRLIRRWIVAGMPWGQANDPTVVRVSVYPDKRSMPQRASQQLIAWAHYSDGRVEDVTGLAQYESNDGEVASVDAQGLVRSYSAPGDAAIMVRYQGHVTVFRALVPSEKVPPSWSFEPKTLVDVHTAQKWRDLNLMPSPLCSDEEFIRRATLQICGTLPTPAEVLAFLADNDPTKRDKLIDRLLERPEYGYFFANKWADILRVKRRGDPGRSFGTFSFHDWLRQAVQSDLPYDQFARSILCAAGDERSHPPVVWYKEIDQANQFVDDFAQVFLGLRIACAQCHHHPFEKWSQDDYWGLAAFFGRVRRKEVLEPGQQPDGQQRRAFLITVRREGNVINKRTGQPAAFKPLDAEAVEVQLGVDPRHQLADWLARKDNPFFARAVVNRYWAHFFGRGIVDPLDDMRITNPPSNEALLDALAKDFIEHGYSLKHLIRTICKSRTYQLSSVPNEFNKFDRKNFARFYPQRMTAEVLYDAVNQVLHAPSQFNPLPQDRHAPNRAIMLPDETYNNYFLTVFGKPARSSACECERVNDANLAQALHLLNSDEIQGKLARGGGRADLLARDTNRDERSKVEEIYLWALSRKPQPDELQIALEYLERLGPPNRKTAYENLLWTLINAKEFSFIR